MNRAMLIGRLGADPQIRTLPSGEKAASLRVATDEFFKNDKKETVKRTEWHNVSLYGKLAETAEAYLSKGRLVFIEGRLHTRQWEDKSGMKRYTTEIVGNGIRFLDSNKEADNGTAKSPDAVTHEGLNGNGEAPVPF